MIGFLLCPPKASLPARTKQLQHRASRSRRNGDRQGVSLRRPSTVLICDPVIQRPFWIVPPFPESSQIYHSVTSILSPSRAALASAFFSAIHATILAFSSVSSTTSSIFNGDRLKGS